MFMSIKEYVIVKQKDGFLEDIVTHIYLTLVFFFHLTKIYQRIINIQSAF